MIQRHGFRHYLTSSKTGDGVDEAIESIIKSWMKANVKDL